MMELRGTGRNRPGFKAAQHSLTRHKNVPGEPRNPRLVWVGRDLKEHFIPTPCHGRDTSHCPRLLPLPGIQGSPSCSGKAEQQHQGGSAEPTLLGKRVPKETAPASTAKSGGGRIRNVQRHFGISYTIPTGGFAAIPYSPELHLWALLTGRSSHGITPWMQLEGTQGGHPMGSPHGCSWKGPKEVIPWDHPMDAAGRGTRRSSHGITPWMQLEGTQGAPDAHPGLQSWAGTPFTQPWDHQGWKSPPRSPSPSWARPPLGTQPRALSATSSPQTQTWEIDLLTQLWLHLFCFSRSFLQPPALTGTCVGHVGMEEGHIPGIQHF
ncbi:uncharacterized protein LOC108961679 isoform X27 [Serinus canaria]|uniref:uncharacterized protein LOC108961679 isoform X24 n=1 Tax=Serinus canaria TaxID=9135 RepID=UPI0021CCB30C|nr:uncharacterized protein LOC108961679 isoform X24 [Serinus canaria]XP_050832642.1 uncharacterized protein LOC108961679 isoform X27 [Serinus canaria]